VSRVILFAEVPCFYAAVERADESSLVDRPIIVGGDPRKRGLVQGASEEALAAGVMLDQPVHDALRLCPEARAVRTNMKRYREVSGRLFVCLRRGFDRLEPFGLGAAYLDVTSSPDLPEEIARRLQGIVADELGLGLRAGIAAGKFHARLAAGDRSGEISRAPRRRGSRRIRLLSSRARATDGVSESASGDPTRGRRRQDRGDVG